MKTPLISLEEDLPQERFTIRKPSTGFHQQDNQLKKPILEMNNPLFLV